MLTAGEAAPQFELPAVVDGEFEMVTLEDHLGDNVVVLAFYPADFNPSCSEERSGLDDLDLFTMQKDVQILAISADSIYSHRRFADEYDLHIPLLADLDATVAREYGVAVEAPTPERYRQTKRAVFVVAPDGAVQYAWATDDLDVLPDVDTVREAVESVGGDDTAQARYRVGHAHYMEGRRAFTSAMGEFSEKEWMMAQGDFAQARDEFEEAADLFDTAARFGTDDDEVTYFERAEDKAEALWRAADWLSGSASAYASGEGADAQQRREDAETPLEAAREIHEPPSPDDFPPDEDPFEVEDEEHGPSMLPADDEVDATLDADFDEAMADDAIDEETPPAREPEDESSEDAGTEYRDERESSDDDADEAANEHEIDEEELQEITAELEEQTAKAAADERNTDESTADEQSDDEATDEVDLDLTDPTDGDDEDDTGAHGVPDSL